MPLAHLYDASGIVRGLRNASLTVPAEVPELEQASRIISFRRLEGCSFRFQTLVAIKLNYRYSYSNGMDVSILLVIVTRVRILIKITR